MTDNPCVLYDLQLECNWQCSPGEAVWSVQMRGCAASAWPFYQKRLICFTKTHRGKSESLNSTSPSHAGLLFSLTDKDPVVTWIVIKEICFKGGKCRGLGDVDGGG